MLSFFESFAGVGGHLDYNSTAKKAASGLALLLVV